MSRVSDQTTYLPFMQARRNFSRSFPCRPLVSAWAEQALPSGVIGLLPTGDDVAVDTVGVDEAAMGLAGATIGLVGAIAIGFVAIAAGFAGAVGAGVAGVAAAAFAAAFFSFFVIGAVFAAGVVAVVWA